MKTNLPLAFCAKRNLLGLLPILLLLLAQREFAEAVVMVHHVHQCREPTIVIETARAIEQSASQGRRTVAVLW